MTQRVALVTAMLSGIVMLAGCTAPEAAGPTAPDAANPPAASGLTQRVSFAHIEMDLPENWGVYASGNSAVVGILAGGNCDIPLRVEIHYEQDVESLVPTCCPQHAPPVAVTSVRTIESGFRPVGDKTAQFRRFTATCADQTIGRGAWLLPDAKVAIVEQQTSPEIDLVVRQMQVGTLKDVVFENVTFHIPPSWNIAVDGATAVIGKFPVGERDSQLVVTKNFTQSIDDLAPKADCHAGEVGDPGAGRHALSSRLLNSQSRYAAGSTACGATPAKVIGSEPKAIVCGSPVSRPSGPDGDWSAATETRDAARHPTSNLG